MLLVPATSTSTVLPETGEKALKMVLLLRLESVAGTTIRSQIHGLHQAVTMMLFKIPPSLLMQ